MRRSFYTRPDVIQVSKELLGKHLCTCIDGVFTSGRIVETEAYRALGDKACHAYNNRRTPRTETMFAIGGTAYIYLCYGIHHLFNVITGPKDVAQGVLIRAVEPIQGIPAMLQRRNLTALKRSLTAGPGSMSKALGITTAYKNASLLGDEIWLEDTGFVIPESEIIASPRVGVAYAEEDALLPWRFRIKNSKWTSPAK